MLRTFRELDIFVAVYEQRSFTSAARSNNATQSGVSRCVKLLEDALGVKLFLRNNKLVEPTPAADRLYKSCTDILRIRESAISSLDSFKHGLKGQVVVGLTPAMVRVVVGPTLLRYTAAHPNVSLRVIHGYSDDLARQVLAGTLDFALLPIGPVSSAYLEYDPFLEMSDVLVTRRRADGPQGGTACLSRLHPLDLVVPSKSSPRRRALDSYLSANRIAVRTTLELDSAMGTLSVLKRSTNWAAIMSPMAICDKSDLQDLVARPIVDPPLLVKVAVAKLGKRTLSLAAKSFLSIFAEETAKLITPLFEQPEAA